MATSGSALSAATGNGKKGGLSNEKLIRSNGKNPELKVKIEELDKTPDSTVQDYIKAAAEYGVKITEADFAPAGSQGELADDELEAVTGGNECLCCLGGGGEYTANPFPDGPITRCTCVFAGYGA